MKIRILCVGKIKEKFYRQRIQELEQKIKKKAELEIIEVEDERTPDGSNEGNLNRIRRAEGERLLHYLQNDAEELVIALCIDGKKYNQELLKKTLQNRIQNYGIRRITYIIGGSVGLDERVVRRADIRLSFSDMTFPHQLMRVMLLEQISDIYL